MTQQNSTIETIMSDARRELGLSPDASDKEVSAAISRVLAKQIMIRVGISLIGAIIVHFINKRTA